MVNAAGDPRADSHDPRLFTAEFNNESFQEHSWLILIKNITGSLWEYHNYIKDGGDHQTYDEERVFCLTSDFIKQLKAPRQRRVFSFISVI